MDYFLEGARWFIWPLGLCSLLTVFIIVERLIALRGNRIIPRHMVASLLRGEVQEVEDSSVGAAIVAFCKRNKPDAEGVKALAQLELSRMERGLFLLEIVIGVAPLLGLLGTVWGLVEVFSAIDPATGMPNPEVFVQGIAMALSTTVLGLIIAIVAIIGNSYLNRLIDTYAAQFNVVVERLLDLTGSRPGPATQTGTD